MKKFLSSRIFWGTVLIIVGILVLLDSLDILNINDLLLLIVSGFAAVFFLGLYITKRDQWWWLVPGISFLGIAAAAMVNWLYPDVGDQWSGTIVLVMIGISFISIYLFESEHWWTLVPGGAAITIGVLSGITSSFDPAWGLGLFVVGLAITFALVAILPSKAGQMTWAWIPAGSLVFLGLFLVLTGGRFLGYVIPLLLIVGGSVLVIRYARG